MTSTEEIDISENDHNMDYHDCNRYKYRIKSGQSFGYCRNCNIEECPYYRRSRR